MAEAGVVVEGLPGAPTVVDVEGLLVSLLTLRAPTTIWVRSTTMMFQIMVKRAIPRFNDLWNCRA
jgi:hypothetical protein